VQTAPGTCAENGKEKRKKMENDAEEFLRGVNDFAASLVKKGYIRFFMTNGAYPDRLAGSLKQYLFASMMGEEPGVAKGLSLRTYLSWEGDQKESVEVYFKVGLEGQYKLLVKSMEILKIDQFRSVLDRVMIVPITEKDIPTCRQALRLIDPIRAVKPRHKIRV